MIFLHDTRDKIGKHNNVDKYLLENGHTVTRRKMNVGDITLFDDQSVCIDLKQNLVELSGNLFPDKSRFVRELERAQQSGIKLIILIEDNSVSSMTDLLNWTNPHPNRNAMTPNGERIYRIISALSAKYKCDFIFCNKRNTGRKIIELLCGNSI